ncbi:hypothetical protein RDI58_001592 [Solanum bulbocastanum]|uniref:Uncharacterized protein n=1 Tax=Solanum bulbocastanum TaxID=147425 RepID=A0AAN8U9V3_SOLBU
MPAEGFPLFCLLPSVILGRILRLENKIKKRLENKIKKRLEILLFHIGKVIVGLVLAKVTLDFEYLFTDDLTRAVNQFYSPPSGEGWFSQPPTPTPPPENSSLELIPGARIEGGGPADCPGKSERNDHSREREPGGMLAFPSRAPLGLYGAWPAFALTHHLVIWFVAA